MFWVVCVAVRVFRLLEDGDRATLPPSSSQHHRLLLITAPAQVKPKYLEMDFPRLIYSPLRPQTTIAIDQVNTTKSDTHPNVKIPIVLTLQLITKGF